MEKLPQKIETEFNKICHDNGYIISELLGSGSYGRVYLALRGKPLTDDRDDLGVYAIKIALDTPIMNRNGNGFKVIVMEKMEKSLHGYICEQPGYALRETEARNFLRQIVLGLLEIHRKGIVHRDLKPENILMKKDMITNEWIIKISDFGFARRDDILTTVIGTPEYMAPEIYKKKYGAEVDLWALGGIAYFMLCGTLPMYNINQDDIQRYVQGVTQITLPQRFSSASKDFVSRLLTKEVSNRLSFAELPKHPFISSCINFSILINPINNDEPPTIHNYTVDLAKCLEAFVPGSGKTGPGVLLWKNLITHLLREIKDMPGVPKCLTEDPTQVCVFTQDGLANLESKVDFEDKLSFDNIEAFVYFKASPPLELKIAGTPKYEFLSTDIINSESVPQREKAETFLKLIHKIHDLYLYIMDLCSTALKGIEIMEKVSSSYVNGNIVPILNDLYRKVGAGSGKGFFSLVTPGRTDGTNLKMFNESNKTVFKMVIQQYGILATFLDDMAARASSEADVIAMGKSLSFAFTQTNVTISGTSIVFDRAIETFYELWNALANHMSAFSDLHEMERKIKALETTFGDKPQKMFNDENDLCKEFMERHPKWSVKVHLAEKTEGQMGTQKKKKVFEESEQTSVMVEKFLQEHEKCIKMEEEIKRLNEKIESLEAQLEMSISGQKRTKL